MGDIINISDISKAYQSHAGEFFGQDKQLSFVRASASFNDTSRGIKVRPPFSRKAYEEYRPGETIPDYNSQDGLHHIMQECTDIYNRVGVIKSVIDMMSDFAVEGLEIVHPDAGPNLFYKAWQKKINIRDRAERFVSWNLKGGNAVVRRQMSTLNRTTIREMIKVLGTDMALDLESATIPVNYIFFNPSTIELLGDSFAAYASKKRYGIKISSANASAFLSQTKATFYPDVYNSLFPELKAVIENRPSGNAAEMVVELPADKLYVSHYKKDDHEMWALPIIYSVLEDVYYNFKVKQAKTSTLDSMINVTRIWKLGDHTNGIYPAPGQAARLSDMLSNHTGGGAIDLIWDSTISLEEFYPPIESLSSFEENYHNILVGLGIPESLLGGATDKNKGGASTVTNMGFKNMIKRLEYSRQLLTDWINTEIDIIQKAMGFRKRPYIRFANEDLHEERTYFNLILQLMDRNVISQERVLEIIKEVPFLEQLRVQNEEKARDAGTMPAQAGPFHNPDAEEQRAHEAKMTKMQAAARSAAGGSNSSNLSKKKGKPTKTNGRPSGSKDSVRRSRGPKKSGTASLMVTASSMYDVIENTLNAHFVSHFGVRNVRSMTAEQKKITDDCKLYALSQLGPSNTLSEDDIIRAVSAEQGTTKYAEFNDCFTRLISELAQENVTQEQRKLLATMAYVEIHASGEEDFEHEVTDANL